MIKSLIIVSISFMITYTLLRILITSIKIANRNLLASEALRLRRTWSDLFYFTFGIQHPSFKDKYQPYVVKGSNIYYFQRISAIFAAIFFLYGSCVLFDSLTYSSTSRIISIMGYWLLYGFQLGYDNPGVYRMISYLEGNFTAEEVKLGYVWLTFMLYLFSLVFLTPKFIRIRNLFFRPFVTRQRDEEKEARKRKKNAI
jgi:heme exporter protein D